MKKLGLALVVVLAVSVMDGQVAHAKPVKIDDSAHWDGLAISVTREVGGSGSRGRQGQPAYPRTEQRFVIACEQENTASGMGSCLHAIPCATDDGESGFLHDVFERRWEGVDEVSDWVARSLTCRSRSASVSGRVDQRSVDQAFQELDWPGAELVLEPRGTLVLVNRAMTARASGSPTQQRWLEVQGYRTAFEATAVSWTWHWGDGTSVTTDHPGAPWPDGSVSHRYLRAAKGLEVRVDVTYAGRARPVGEGWRDVSETLTVRGESQRVDVVEAIPQLVR